MDKRKEMIRECKITKFISFPTAVLIFGEFLYLLVSYPFKPSLMLLLIMSVLLFVVALMSHQLQKALEETERR